MTAKSYLTFKIGQGFDTIVDDISWLQDQPLFRIESGETSIAELVSLPVGTEVKMSYLFHTGKHFRRDETMLRSVFERIDTPFSVVKVPPLPHELALSPWNSDLPPISAPSNYALFASRIAANRGIIEKQAGTELIIEAARRINDDASVSAPFKP